MQASTKAIEDKILLHFITEIAPNGVSFKQFADTAYSVETNELAFGTRGSQLRRNYQTRVRNLNNKIGRGTAEIDKNFELEVCIDYSCYFIVLYLSKLLLYFPNKKYISIEPFNIEPMSSSESEADSVSLTTIKTPKKKRAALGQRSDRKSPTRPTPKTKAERDLAKRTNEENEIPRENIIRLNEGWSTTMRDVGRVDIRDKRSDDGKRTYLGTTVIVMCHNEYELLQTHIRLACTGTGNKLVLTRPSINTLFKLSKEVIIRKFDESHGESHSRAEGINRSFSRAHIQDTDSILLTIDGVDKLINTE